MPGDKYLITFRLAACYVRRFIGGLVGGVRVQGLGFWGLVGRVVSKTTTVRSSGQK